MFDGDPRDMEEAPSVPMNLEAELGLLGALLFAPEALRTVADRVTADDFAEPFHGRLYALIASGEPCDPSVLHGRLTSDPAYSSFGGQPALYDLIEKAPNPKLAPELALQVADAAVRRRLIVLGQEAIQRARSPDGTGYDAVAQTRAALEEAERGSAP